MISLVSDTETRPTPGMREAMARAEVGDEQRGEDPTVNALQTRVAELLGKEAALWLPTGTMCNVVAAKAHTNPAEVIVAEFMAHVIRAESGGMGLISGVLVEPIESERGVFSGADLREALDRIDTVGPPYSPRPTLLCVEQTHNFGGGSVWTLDELQAVSDLARHRGMAVHMDGARLLNACVASGVSAAAYGDAMDSVWIDFTKGLGAPIGAVLAGSADFIEEARRYKHVFGGAMRQAGIAAAGCLYALDHQVDRLADDHANARHFASGLASIPGIRVLNPNPETNIVFFDATEAAGSNVDFLAHLRRHDIRMGMTRGNIRAVTHLDVNRADCERVVEVAARISQSATPSSSAAKV